MPTPTFEMWDKDYNFYEKYLTSEIMRTQMGLSSQNNGVHTWCCYPSARTHTQTDTATIIKDSKAIIGDWRIVCNRSISFIDSAVYSNKKIFRIEKLIYDEKDADVFLNISESRINMYGTEKGKDKYKSGGSRNYKIVNGRFLLSYGLSKASGAISQIGIDKKGNLIINSFWVQERKKKGQYIVYHSIVNQTIYERQ